MAHYLVQASYTSGSWAAQIKNPQNRIEQVGKMFGGIEHQIQIVISRLDDCLTEEIKFLYRKLIGEKINITEKQN